MNNVGRNGVFVLSLLGGSAALGAIPVVEGQEAIVQSAQYYGAGLKNGLLNRHEADVISSNVHNVIQQNQYRRGGRDYLNENLEHFVTEHRQFAVEEERLAGCGRPVYSRVFRKRIDHIRSCPVCSSVVRQCVRSTPIQVVEFVPNAALVSPRVFYDNKWISVDFKTGKYGFGFYGTRPGSNSRCGVNRDAFYGGLRFGNRAVRNGLFASRRHPHRKLGHGTGWFANYGGRRCPVRWF
jgi:hypothetical protein